jgi:hypothetical protein
MPSDDWADILAEDSLKSTDSIDVGDTSWADSLVNADSESVVEEKVVTPPPKKDGLLARISKFMLEGPSRDEAQKLMFGSSTMPLASPAVINPEVMGDLAMKGMVKQPKYGVDEFGRPVINDPSKMTMNDLYGKPEDVKPPAGMYQRDEKESMWTKIAKVFEPTWKDRVAKSQVAMDKAKRTGLSPHLFEATIPELVKGGTQDSLTVMMARQKLPDLGIYADELNEFENLIYKSTSLLPDIPWLTIGFWLGGGLASPLTATGGAVGFLSGLKAMYADRLRKGEVKDYGDFYDRLKHAVFETAKGEATGIAAKAAGLRFGTVGEIAAFETVGKALENEFPSARGFLEAGVMIGGLKAVEYTNTMLNLYEASGTKPQDAIANAYKVATGEDISTATPDAIAAAQAKMQEVIKKQTELAQEDARKRFEKGLDELTIEELGRKQEDLYKIKARPIQDTGLKEATKTEINEVFKLNDEQLAEAEAKFTSKKGNLYYKVNGSWYDSNGVAVTNHFVIKAAEKGLADESQVPTPDHKINEPSKSEAAKVEDTKDTETEHKLKTKLRKKKVETIEPEDQKPATEIELDTNIRDSEDLNGENSPLFQKAEEAEVFKGLFERKGEAVYEDVDLFTQKLINDVNRYYHGDKTVDIEKTKAALDKLATRGDELRSEFQNGVDHLQWMDFVSEASRWAKTLDRKLNKPSGDTGTKLYSGIPIDQVPKALDNLYKFAKERAKYAKKSELGKNFSKWFGKSKITTIEGEPIIVYHASPFNFSEFDPNKRYGGIGIHFGTEEQARRRQVETFKSAIDSGEDIKNIYPTILKGYLRMENPLVISRDPGIWDVEVFTREIILSDSLEYKVFPKTWDRISKLIDDYDLGNKKFDDANRDLEKLIQEEGYDGIIYPNSVEGTGPSYLVFNSNQFKEVKNAGTYNIGTGNIFYSGIPVEEAVVKGAKTVADYVKKARSMKSFKPREALHRLREGGVRSFIDKSGNIRREMLKSVKGGYEILQQMYLAKGASTRAAMMLNQMRKDVYRGLNRNEKRVLDTLILSDRMLDIAKYKSKGKFKFPEGLEPEKCAAYNELFGHIEKISPEREAIIKDRAQKYFEWMKKPLQDMLDANLITEQEFKDLSSHNYRRLKIVDIFDRRQPSIKKTKMSVYESGVEPLAHGRKTDIFEPSSEVMALEVFNRAYSRIMKNKANMELSELAKRDPDNGFAMIRDKEHRIPSGWSRIYVYEGGERKPLYISPEMTKEWITSNPEMSYKMSQFLRYMSGTPLLKTMATGINWGFALANVPKDVMHAWFAARVFENGKWRPLYSSHLPIYALQMGVDMATVAHDAFMRKGRYIDYINEGGGMEFLTLQGRLLQRGRHIEGPLAKFFNFAGYFGETGEIMTRLAIRERALKQKKPARESTFAARDYMDFGQGGDITKSLDNAIPYLGAGLQGTRGLFRSFKDNPVKSAYKLAQFGSVVTGLYMAAQNMAPKTIGDLKGDVNMQNNVCIPFGDDFGFEDEKGQIRYPFWKLPLDNGQKFFKVLFEAATDKHMGKEIDVDNVVKMLSEYSPVTTQSVLPPTISGVLGYVTNKDFWLNEDIWKGSDKPFSWPKSKKESIPGKTPQVFTDLGQVTGLSPERMNYVASELVTNGTVWSAILNEGYNKAFADLPKETKRRHFLLTLARTPVFRRFIGVTNPYSKHAKDFEVAAEDDALKNAVETIGLDERVDGYLFYGTHSRKEVVDYIKGFKDRATVDKLKERFIFSEKTKNLKDRSFWLRLQGLSPEARAKLYVKELNSKTGEEREEFMKQVKIVSNAGGVISDEFKRNVMKLYDQKSVK